MNEHDIKPHKIRYYLERRDPEFDRKMQDVLLVYQMCIRDSPTPGVIHVGKTSGAISVQCRCEGYQETVGSVGSEFQAATFGNIILGGIIGVVVDAASGAMSKYPESVTFTLLPLAFNSAAERDHFFDELRTTFLADYEEVVSRIKTSCKQSECETQLKAADAARDQRLADIEQRTLAAKVAAL